MELNYRKYGENNPPLIIVHGLYGSSDNWVSIGKALSNKFEVFIIDQRNHGQSFHSDSWTYHDMVSDLEEYIDVHQLGRVNLLGHSMGGKTVMCFASMHPSKVISLIVADISPKQYPVGHDFILDAISNELSRQSGIAPFAGIVFLIFDEAGWPLLIFLFKLEA